MQGYFILFPHCSRLHQNKDVYVECDQLQTIYAQTHAVSTWHLASISS